MKKMVKLLVSVLMVLSITFYFAVQSFAFDYDLSLGSENYYNESIASAYFAYNSAFSSNEKGSCAFVAIQMLLSYYDSFWNDDFVPEKYDYSGRETTPNWSEVEIIGNTIKFWGSPGVEAERLLATYEECSSYYDFIEKYKGDYFQLYLMDLAIKKGFISDFDSSYMSQNTDESENVSLSATKIVDFLQFYLYDAVDGIGFTAEEVTLKSIIYSASDPNYSEETVRDKLISLVSSGTPVIYGGFKDESDNATVASDGQDKKGHAMIAYDYNPESDSVFYHMGNADIFSNDTSNHYDYHPSIIWLEINENEFPHECSNNYHEKDAGPICLCKLDIHPAHTHSFKCLERDASSHRIECEFCLEIDADSHDFSYVRIDGTTHSIDCVCGYHRVGVHIVKSGTHTCLQCRARVENGYVAISSIGQEVSINSIQIDDVTHITDNGIIVLSDEDYEDFINGTLTVQELYERFGLAYD